MSEYTPTTEEIIEHWSATRGSAVDPEAANRKAERERMFRRWLAAHDAETRARAAGVVADETEWEYGYGIGPTYWTAYNREYAEESRMASEHIVRRTKAIPAGEWVPVEQEGET